MILAIILFSAVIIALLIDLIFKEHFISQQVCIITMLIVGFLLLNKRNEK
jgi:drug/metabolite transporter (DMT)-like permease